MAEYESDRDRNVVVARRSSFPAWLIAILVLIVLVVAAFAFGLINIDQTAETKLPDIKVETSGGQTPKFDVNTADIQIGTKEKTIEVPTVSVEKAEK